MTDPGFVDYYELLQLSASADTDTVERVFRHLAKKMHPDNPESANPAKFRLIIEAHSILCDPVKRAGYDVKYQEYWKSKWQLVQEAGNGSGYEDDRVTRESLLSLLYVQRRRDRKNPGLSDYDMARLIGKPYELVEFHIWYLKAKGWVERLDTGFMAITAPGVDEVEKSQLRLPKDRLLTDGRAATPSKPSTETEKLPRPKDGPAVYG